MAQEQKITEKAIFEKDKKVLLVLENEKKWELPGGKIEFNEKPEDALRRELKEELGFKNVLIKNIIDVFSFRTKFKTTNYQWIVLVYKCRLNKNVNIKLSYEHSAYKWCTLLEIKKLKMVEGYKKSIEKDFKNIITSM